MKKQRAILSTIDGLISGLDIVIDAFNSNGWCAFADADLTNTCEQLGMATVTLGFAHPPVAYSQNTDEYSLQDCELFVSVFHPFLGQVAKHKVTKYFDPPGFWGSLFGCDPRWKGHCECLDALDRWRFAFSSLATSATITGASTPTTIDLQLDKPVLAIALLVQYPSISPTELASVLGVSRGTLYSSSEKWRHVRQTLIARDGNRPKGVKSADGHIDAEDDDREFHPTDD